MKYSKRSLQAVTRRITVKALAEEIGISPSTYYRYKNGQVKNPKINFGEEIEKIWDNLRDSKPAKNVAEKRENQFSSFDHYQFRESTYHPKINSRHDFYSIPRYDLVKIPDICQELHDLKQYEFFQFILEGKDGNGNELHFSTPIFYINDLDKFQEEINSLLAKPSKTLKSAVHFVLNAIEWE